MSANDSAVEKSIVNQLIFGAKMQKRALCESWEFAVESSHLIRAMNAYGAMNSGYSCSSASKTATASSFRMNAGGRWTGTIRRRANNGAE